MKLQKKNYNYLVLQQICLEQVDLFLKLIKSLMQIPEMSETTNAVQFNLFQQ